MTTAQLIGLGLLLLFRWAVRSDFVRWVVLGVILAWVLGKCL